MPVATRACRLATPIGASWATDGDCVGLQTMRYRAVLDGPTCASSTGVSTSLLDAKGTTPSRPAGSGRLEQMVH